MPRAMIQPDLARSGAVSEPAWGSAIVPEVLVMTVLRCENLSAVRLQEMEDNSRVGGSIQSKSTRIPSEGCRNGIGNLYQATQLLGAGKGNRPRAFSLEG